MKIRTIALAGVAALALCGPAAASDAIGWYAGLGAGWDHLGNLEVNFKPGPPGPAETLNTSNSGLFMGNIGYRLANRVRFEVEVGYDRHDVKGLDPDLSAAQPVSGRLSNISGMLDVAYDWRIAPRFDFTLGAGAGIGRADLDARQADGTLMAGGKQVGFMWHAMAGFGYSVTDNLDLTLDWRYRSLSVHKSLGTAFGFINPDTGNFVRFSPVLKNNNEQAIMVGLR